MGLCLLVLLDLPGKSILTLQHINFYVLRQCFCLGWELISLSECLSFFTRKLRSLVLSLIWSQGKSPSQLIAGSEDLEMLTNHWRLGSWLRGAQHLSPASLVTVSPGLSLGRPWPLATGPGWLDSTKLSRYAHLPPQLPRHLPRFCTSAEQLLTLCYYSASLYTFVMRITYRGCDSRFVHFIISFADYRWIIRLQVLTCLSWRDANGISKIIGSRAIPGVQIWHTVPPILCSGKLYINLCGYHWPSG